jgi:hypothetical protein
MAKSASSSSFWARNLVRAALAVSLSAAAGSAQQLSQTSAEAAALPDAPLPHEFVKEAVSVSSSVEAFLASQNPTQNPQHPGAPSLDDLGLKSDGDVKQQALMDRRTHMLKVHQRLGLITVIPVAAACISSAGAPPDHGQYGNTTSRDVHVGIAGLAIAMYGATAYYAIRAPKVSNEPARGGVKWHKYLIYLHAPGMVLTPILGAMAFNQINSGQKVHGIASAHGAVASVTAVSYGLAIVAVSWPIHLKF